MQFTPKSLGKSIEVKTWNRPLKILYIVPYEESDINHMVIDAVFHESYTRWGGAYTLIVPANPDAMYDQKYEGWIKFFDPDFVYAYVELNEEMVKSIDHWCSPIAFLKHELGQREDTKELTSRSFLPQWDHYFSAISSKTLTPSPRVFEFYQKKYNPKLDLKVITQFNSFTSNRFISDNFGTAFETQRPTYGLPGLFQTLCLVPDNLSKNTKAGDEQSTSIKDIFSEMINYQALPIARFAMIHSDMLPRLRQYKWSDSVHLFIGTSLLDRIHFWNARHFTPSHSGNLGTLILGIDLFDDQEWPAIIGEYLNRHNFLGRNGTHLVSLHSYSQSFEKLEKIKAIIQQQTYNIVSLNDEYNKLPIPEGKELKESPFIRSTPNASFKLIEDTNKLVPEVPDHFGYLPARLKGIAGGQWMVELEIQRHNNLSRYSNVVDTWDLPRRRKIVHAFTKNLGKVTSHHKLAILPSNKSFPSQSSRYEQLSYELFLPDDGSFFRHLTLDYYEIPFDDLRVTISKNSYKDLSISDKGQNLRGVISMFRTLSEAYAILTNKFWRNVLGSANENSTRHLSFNKKKLMGFLPNDRVTKERIQKELNFKDMGKVGPSMECNLLDTLEQLVRINIFYQVYQKRCSYCGHMNSRSFDSMRVQNHCNICKREYFAPIDIEWAYQLNEFVYRSLVKQNGLTVLWALGFLQDRVSHNSFWYLPEVDLYEDYDGPEKNEIDALCVIDGLFYVIEVKRSVSQVVNKPEEIDKFVREVNLIQPDVAMLAFEQYCQSDDELDDMKSRLAIVEKDIRERIEPSIELKSVVAFDIPGFNEHPVDIGHIGRRTHEIWYGM